MLQLTSCELGNEYLSILGSGFINTYLLVGISGILNHQQEKWRQVGSDSQIISSRGKRRWWGNLSVRRNASCQWQNIHHDKDVKLLWWWRKKVSSKSSGKAWNTGMLHIPTYFRQRVLNYVLYRRHIIQTSTFSSYHPGITLRTDTNIKPHLPMTKLSLLSKAQVFQVSSFPDIPWNPWSWKHGTKLGKRHISDRVDQFPLFPYNRGIRIPYKRWDDHSQYNEFRPWLISWYHVEPGYSHEILGST